VVRLDRTTHGRRRAPGTGQGHGVLQHPPGVIRNARVRRWRFLARPGHDPPATTLPSCRRGFCA